MNNSRSLKSHRHYIFFLILFSIAGYWGLTMFQESDAHMASFPVTPGEEMGIFIDRQYLSFEKMLEKAQAEDLFEPYFDQNKRIIESEATGCWIRIPLTNPTQAEQDYILQIEYPWIDAVYLYTMDEHASLSTWRSGDMIAIDDKMIPHDKHAFNIRLRPEETKTYYVFLRDDYWVNPTLKLWKQSSEYFNNADFQDKFIYAYVGLMLGLFITNCCVYLVFRYQDLVYYLCYLAAVGILQCVNFQLHYPIMRWLTPSETYVFPLNLDYFAFGGLLVLSGGFLILFSNEFLQFSTLAPRLHKIIKNAGKVALVCTPIIVFGPGRMLGQNIEAIVAVIWGSTNLIAFSMGIYAAIKKLPQARYFLPALLILAIVSSRFNWDILTGSVVTADVIMQWLYASCLEMIAFTYGLVDRFLSINRQKEEAQKQALVEMQNFANLSNQYNTQLNDEVQARTSDLNQANQQKDELLRIIAHDLKSPIDGVIKLSEQLASNAPDPKQQELAHQIENNASNLSDLMKNLLEWAKIRTQQNEITAQPYLVLDLFEAAVTTHSPQAKLKNIKINTETPEQLFAHCDFDYISVVLRNLLSNAIKFSDPHSEVHIRACKNNNKTVITLQDSGCGMTEERVQAIQTGQTLKSKLGSKGETGTGIGLQLCRTVLATHNSDLIINSQLGQGTCCRFELDHWEFNS